MAAVSIVLGIESNIFSGFYGISRIRILRCHGHTIFPAIAVFQGNGSRIILICLARKRVGRIGIDSLRKLGQVYRTGYFISGCVFHTHGQGIAIQLQGIRIGFQRIVAILGSREGLLQLRYVDSIRGFSTSSNTRNLTGHRAILLANRNSCIRRFPGS